MTPEDRCKMLEMQLAEMREAYGVENRIAMERGHQVDFLKAALRDAIEGHEGMVPDFWRSPLGKKLEPLIPLLWPGRREP